MSEEMEKEGKAKVSEKKLRDVALKKIEIARQIKELNLRCSELDRELVEAGSDIRSMAAYW